MNNNVVNNENVDLATAADAASTAIVQACGPGTAVELVQEMVAIAVDRKLIPKDRIRAAELALQYLAVTLDRALANRSNNETALTFEQAAELLN